MVATACSTGTSAAPAPAAAPQYAPIETVTVRAAPGEVTRRLVALYAADGITVASNTGGTVTTAPVQTVALSAGAGATRATGSVAYFYRATIAGDSVSLVTLALWGRFVTRSGADPESPPSENPVTAQCAEAAQCAPFLARMRGHAAKLRTGP